MANKGFDFVVFIGRFQPFHKGHLSVIQAGLACSEKMIVICGSANQARSSRNPWSVSEREAMIRGAISEADNTRLHVAPLVDTTYNDQTWVEDVQAAVNRLVDDEDHDVSYRTPRIALIGHSQDLSGYYVNLFPQWAAVEVANFEGVSATPIRETILRDAKPEKVADVLPENVCVDILRFCGSENYLELKAEREFVADYQQAWEAAPYPPTFVTADAVLLQSGHILMIERKARPGLGLLALPGGFVDGGEKIVDACLRELREETCLNIPSPILKACIKGREVFDDPYRSARGRTITHAFYIELEPNKTLPKVEGGDDAQHAMWVALADLDATGIFEDHYSIIQKMVAYSEDGSGLRRLP